MAGNGNTLVRPKQFQNPDRIVAGSPLAIQGIFLEVIRERFKEDAGIDIVWREDITLTDILIEAGYNEETESRGETPAVYINRLQTVPSKQIVGDRVGVRLPDHLEGFGALTTVQLSIDCISNDNGESAVIGDIVQFMILASQDVIQREFGLYDLSHPALGQTVPYEQNTTKWNTQISFAVQFWIRWSQVPIAPLLQQVYTRVTPRGENASNAFTESVINSLRRGDVFDPTQLRPGADVPPSRISIVGPPGPAGPPGPPGAPGVSPEVEALCVDQNLTGVIDGVNKVFTTDVTFKHDTKFKELFYVNGIRQKIGASCDYTISESTPLAGFDTITMTYEPIVGDVLIVDYYADTP